MLCCKAVLSAVVVLQCMSFCLYGFQVLAVVRGRRRGNVRSSDDQFPRALRPSPQLKRDMRRRHTGGGGREGAQRERERERERETEIRRCSTRDRQTERGRERGGEKERESFPCSQGYSGAPNATL